MKALDATLPLFFWLLGMELCSAIDIAKLRSTGELRKACSRRGATPQPPSRINTSVRLRKLRVEMAKESSIHDRPYDAFIISSGDEHQSEVVDEYDRRREFISGFSGSSGDAIVTMDKAALWTDGRYHLQADDQLNCDWLLMRDGHSNVPTMAEWLKQELKAGARVGADPKLIPAGIWETLRYELENNSIQLVEVRVNLVDLVWTQNRPPKTRKPAYVWDMKYAGKTWMKKVEELRQELKHIGADAMVITALDEIAWLLNIRGRDIPNNPFLSSYIILSQHQIHMYVDDVKITSDVRRHLRTEFGVNPFSVKILAYDDVWRDLTTLAQAWRVVLVPSNCVYSPGASQAISSYIPEDKRLYRQSPIIFLKAKKNAVEITGMESAHIRDAAALCDFLAYFEDQFLKGDVWDELRVAQVLTQMRYEQQFCTGNSFTPIVAYASNGAKPHYEPSNSTNVNINSTSTLVIDSGGQYLDGTTDVTRTIHFGEPTQEQKECYTRVLMGSIQLSQLTFPASLKSALVDVMARAPLWDAGLDYLHGTGHGIGVFLSVHESPINVWFNSLKGQQIFKPGYFFTNEPGYYKEGEFGIRLENVLQVIQKNWAKHPSGQPFLGFKDITLVPYEPKLIDISMLTVYHRRWLNTYNARIRTLVGAELKRQRKMNGFYWMMEKTKHIPEYGSNSNNLAGGSICLLLTLASHITAYLLY